MVSVGHHKSKYIATILGDKESLTKNTKLILLIMFILKTTSHLRPLTAIALGLTLQIDLRLALFIYKIGQVLICACGIL